jgi:hypothetical protein
LGDRKVFFPDTPTKSVSHFRLSMVGIFTFCDIVRVPLSVTNGVSGKNIVHCAQDKMNM